MDVCTICSRPFPHLRHLPTGAISRKKLDRAAKKAVAIAEGRLEPTRAATWDKAFFVTVGKQKICGLPTCAQQSREDQGLIEEEREGQRINHISAGGCAAY